MIEQILQMIQQLQPEEMAQLAQAMQQMMGGAQQGVGPSPSGGGEDPQMMQKLAMQEAQRMGGGRR